MSQQIIPGISYQSVTTTAPGSPAQQALANQQAAAAKQNAANNISGGRRRKYKGGAIALPPIQGASSSTNALNANVQGVGSQVAANAALDNEVNKGPPVVTKGGKKSRKMRKTKTRKTKTQTRKTKTRKTRRSYKKN
jgi:hypothetical protein